MKTKIKKIEKPNTVFLVKAMSSSCRLVFTSRKNMVSYLKDYYGNPSTKVKELPGSEGKILELNYIYVSLDHKNKIKKENLKTYFLVYECDFDPEN